MPKIIIKDKIVDDKWEVLPKAFLGEPPVNKLLLLPMKYWLEHSENLRLPVLGIWIDSDEEVEDIGEKANMFPVIAINFPSFTDGRGFTAGRLLRERYGYNGQLRAIGHVIRDQLFNLKRCGFDAFQLRDGTDLEEALKSLNDFSVTYQGDANEPNPLFRRDQ
ncbi:DUF934 domain-containing protein [uncultured Porticoccus sp.]|uniref:DUF934 domain-containing protein n=1 Tax=uncultured Porticoccus sp. TaxID=1256050 RepID=UPI00261E3201|nr:DUF934 domain-containing protein [uncultured Porticoccus sp.]